MPSHKIFIDTSYVIALINKKDQYHSIAESLVNIYDEHNFMISDCILLKIGNALSRNYKQEAIEIIENFFMEDNITVIHLTQDLFAEGFSLYKTHQDKDWGLIDCISFMIMRSENIFDVLTFDKHFNQAGFNAIPFKYL